MTRRLTKRESLRRWASDRISRWVEQELDSIATPTLEWYEDLAARAPARFNRPIPIETLRAFVHSIQRRRAREAAADRKGGARCSA